MATDNEMTVEALCIVNGVMVRTFDKAWHLALTLPRPVHVSYVGMVRKES